MFRKISLLLAFNNRTPRSLEPYHILGILINTSQIQRYVDSGSGHKFHIRNSKPHDNDRWHQIPKPQREGSNAECGSPKPCRCAAAILPHISVYSTVDRLASGIWRIWLHGNWRTENTNSKARKSFQVPILLIRIRVRVRIRMEKVLLVCFFAWLVVCPSIKRPRRTTTTASRVARCQNTRVHGKRSPDSQFNYQPTFYRFLIICESQDAFTCRSSRIPAASVAEREREAKFGIRVRHSHGNL